MSDTVTVIQADRVAAADYALCDGEYYINAADRVKYCEAVLSGDIDCDILVQSFARHRIAHEPKWLPIEDAKPFQIEDRYLLAHKFSQVIGYWDGNRWINERSRKGSEFVPTHYMPLSALPTPPEQAE